MAGEVAGACCAIHPDRPAEGTCSRCGNFACSDCNATGLGPGVLCTTCAQTVGVSRYHVVPMWRFVLFSVLTWGLYDLYWFWKNWSRIKRADGSDIWPIPRTIFAGFTYFSLITDINTQLAVRDRSSPIPTAMGVGFLVMGGLSRLPDPYSLVSLLAFLFLLPAVSRVRELASDAALAEGARWHARHTVLSLLAVPTFLLVLLGTIMGEDGLQGLQRPAPRAAPAQVARAAQADGALRGAPSLDLRGVACGRHCSV